MGGSGRAAYREGLRGGAGVSPLLRSGLAEERAMGAWGDRSPLPTCRGRSRPRAERETFRLGAGCPRISVGVIVVPGDIQGEGAPSSLAIGSPLSGAAGGKIFLGNGTRPRRRVGRGASLGALPDWRCSTTERTRYPVELVHRPSA